MATSRFGGASPLGSIIRMLAAPRLSLVRSGEIRITLPFLRLIGPRSGEVRVADSDDTSASTAERWVSVISRLVPRLTGLRYETAAAQVLVSYANGPSDAEDPATVDAEMQHAVELLIFLATDNAARFITMGGEQLERARIDLVRALQDTKIDLRSEDAAGQLRRILADV